jgi:sporulation protein YlmC with PRC-barrel domain
METYVILRRSAWETGPDLDKAAAKSTQVGDEVLDEEDGTLGTVCIYQAVDEDAIMEHAKRSDLPADEVIRVADTVFVRDDP